MTLNIVLKAKGAAAVDRDGTAITCAEIARRWLAAGELSLTGAELAAKLLAMDGPLDLIGTKTSTASRPICRSRMRRNRPCAISAPIIC